MALASSRASSATESRTSGWRCDGRRHGRRAAGLHDNGDLGHDALYFRSAGGESGSALATSAASGGSWAMVAMFTPPQVTREFVEG